MKATIKKLLHKIKYPEQRSLYWANYRENPNWGDDLNPWLFQKITGTQPLYCPHPDVPRLLLAGSILHRSGPLDICWGTGILQDAQEKTILLKKAFAVRGQLTAKALEKSNIEPPSVFGDPGLLVSDYIQVDQIKKYRIAIVPHYMDVHDAKILCSEIKAEMICVSLPIKEFVEKMAKAEMVFSSSLHGLICAESLGIPCAWIRFSDKLLGGNFKFHDYLSGTGRGWKGVLPIDLRREKFPGKTEFKNACWQPFEVKLLKENLSLAFPYKKRGKVIE